MQSPPYYLQGSMLEASNVEKLLLIKQAEAGRNRECRESLFLSTRHADVMEQS